MIDWTNCPDVESVPGRCSGQPVVKGTRVLVQGILDNAEDCSAEEIAHDLYGLPVDVVKRILAFAGITPLDYSDIPPLDDEFFARATRERDSPLWPATLADVARRVRAGADLGATLPNFLDNFYCNPEQRAAMIADEPPPLDNARHHALLGAIGEHLARRWNLAAVPAWTDDPSRFLHEAYFTTPIEALWPLLLEESPPAFRRRMIYTEAEPLRRARMPR